MSNRNALARYLSSNAQRWRDSTPLWPAGHLPRKGGDRTSRGLSPNLNVAASSEASKLPISPLAGEMSGRTEGGVKE
ncbi:hypothetical protein EN809_005220 [Mesorhizobium sp. M2E.F.Ca.ET.166.01.1.1]|nr:hypothetical protein EN862_005345 [Mesorhizobium sp. M2E.F.Ca.ET.219.01.1.1]TGS11860.1 hypothetical protein EN852_020605 [Mesorhizobium sp. M2E.F.Ca.ET.209.01.1.1]TGT77004.1 hypothetical protein EN809_005220 [Mesorhizobium sp. M2E.F.Ca.ET.166.01.1.1]TGW03112.1 hypothetical protein EN797_005220 [Mesorhizobium sp. M2E.F.Ca.ET.154.01.1.1]